MSPSPLPSVLVVPVRPDARGRGAAARAVALLSGLADARVAPADPRAIAGLAADHVVVLDPPRWRAALRAHPVLDAPGSATDRLTLLQELRRSPGRVRWVGRPGQWDDLHRVLLTRAAATTAVTS
ncbi:hypothetical protein [Actinomycetospora chiangmaiensis]|uniref:hypothetical protein n=1 Tax=Actinomycetospora chiangmaiensis TaxID=402650 RepID=UPI0003A9D06E|nr:hypothetical protein [Actinomycetospora chiangmaiensis]